LIGLSAFSITTAANDTPEQRIFGLTQDNVSPTGR